MLTSIQAMVIAQQMATIFKSPPSGGLDAGQMEQPPMGDIPQDGTGTADQGTPQAPPAPSEAPTIAETAEQLADDADADELAEVEDLEEEEAEEETADDETEVDE